MIFCFPIFKKVFTFDEFYLEICPLNFRLLCTKKLQIFFSIFMYYSRFFRPTFWFLLPNILKVGLKNLERYIKIEEINLQFFDIKQSKIRWTDLEIKFIKGKTLKKIWKHRIKNLALNVVACPVPYYCYTLNYWWYLFFTILVTWYPGVYSSHKSTHY